MLPLTHLFQQTENVLGLTALIALEWTVILIVLLREWNNVILDLTQHGRADVERDLKLFVWCIFVIFASQIGDLELDFAKFGNDIVETITKDWILLMLINLKV